MTRRLLTAILAVLGGLLLAAGALGQLTGPERITLEPETIIDSGPSGTTSSSTATFTFHSPDDPLATFECSRDGNAYGNCTSPKSYSGLSDGPHTFDVRAISVLSEPDSTPAHAEWTISSDSVAPETTITSSSISGTSASFNFASNEAGSTFECRRDGQSFTSCTSPKSYTSLSGGSHTFYVRATDPSDNTDSTPASATWTVGTDTTPPQTTITSGPAATTSSTSASFKFASNEAGSTFECRRDGQSFTSCTSPKSYSGLSTGSHTFYVRATDASGNSDTTPASATWTVGTDTTPPETTITSGPTGATSSTSATFTFSASQAGSTFECRRNLAAFVACASPMTYSFLADGTHTFEVRATDPSDNVDPTPATATWTVATDSTDAPPVADLRAVAGDHRVRLNWANPTGIGLKRIEIRRGSAHLLVYSGRGTEFIDTHVFNGRTYKYSVVVFDDLGRTSPAAGVFALPHGKLVAPRDGTRVLGAPLLRWLPRANATYYNVQIYRNGKKILSRWPTRARFQLTTRWRYKGHLYRLRDGRYLWYVFPGFGPRTADRYGHVMGHATFLKR
jgi:predicted phage tail protein